MRVCFDMFLLVFFFIAVRHFIAVNFSFFFTAACRFGVFWIVINLYHRRHYKREHTERRGEDEEIQITHMHLEVAGYKPRQHHAECHQTRTESIMCRGEFTSRKIDEVKHIGRKAKSVTELLDEDTKTHPKKTCGLEIS